jgi:hypothetical protein
MVCVGIEVDEFDMETPGVGIDEERRFGVDVDVRFGVEVEARFRFERKLEVRFEVDEEAPTLTEGKVK